MKNKNDKLLALLDQWLSSQYFYCEDIHPEFMDDLSDLIIEKLYGSYEEYRRLQMELSYRSVQEIFEDLKLKGLVD